MKSVVKIGAIACWLLWQGSAEATSLVGSDDLASITQTIIANCPGAVGLTPTFSTSSAAEAALKAGTQEVAPMTRFLQPALTCASPAPNQSEGVVFGLDAAVVLGATDETTTCQLVSSRTLSVTDQNGNPGLDCPDCTGSQYQLGDWRDMLRVLIAGMTHGAGANLTLQDCNSDVRYSLVSAWQTLFQSTCGGASCSSLRHVFRPADGAEISDTLLSILGLPRPTLDAVGHALLTPFCNGGTYDDSDPIRRPCAPEEAVCAADGTLGLVLPVAPPKNAPSDSAYPIQPCSIGVYDWKPAPSAELSSCPGGGLNVFTLCLVPGRNVPGGALSHQCYKVETNDTPFLTPNTVNTKVFNRYLRSPNGSLVLDEFGHEVYGAFHRLHSVQRLAGHTCLEGTASDELGCLPQASRCSLSLARRVATRQSGVAALAVNGVLPTDPNIRKLISKPVPVDVYPLSNKLLMNTMVGSEETTSPAQKSLYACFARQLYADPPVLGAGYIPLLQNGVCQDFDERQCGSVFNKNACKKGVNFCPVIGFATAFPLQVAVGDNIFLSASASDIDDPFDDLQFLWSAPFGKFADPHALATTYQCTQAGSATLQLTVYDGSCSDTFSVNVKCVVP